MDYQLRRDLFSGRTDAIISGERTIPLDKDNLDYLEFLEWNANQETPLDTGAVFEPYPEPPATEVHFDLPVHAPDFIVSSPKISDSVSVALVEAVAEGKKANKSIPFMVLSITHYISDLETRAKQLENDYLALIARLEKLESAKVDAGTLGDGTEKKP